MIRGQKGDENGSNYVHRGIANRSFERRFALADHIQVKGADLKDGMLAIDLVREIPEAMKPRKIEIGGSRAEARPDRGDGQRAEGKRAGLRPSCANTWAPGARRFRGLCLASQLASADAAWAMRWAPRGEISSTVATNIGCVIPDPK